MPRERTIRILLPEQCHGFKEIFKLLTSGHVLHFEHISSSFMDIT